MTNYKHCWSGTTFWSAIVLYWVRFRSRSTLKQSVK